MEGPGFPCKMINKILGRAQRQGPPSVVKSSAGKYREVQAISDDGIAHTDWRQDLAKFNKLLIRKRGCERERFIFLELQTLRTEKATDKYGR